MGEPVPICGVVGTMMPPNVQNIKADTDTAYAEMARDAAAYRLIGQAGWTLVRTAELEELNRVLADIIASTGRVMAQDTSETGEQR